jgi:hypothetical protein
MANVIEILSEMGYKFTDDGEYLRMRPLYRSSDNLTSLQVNKKSGAFKDWSTEESGSLALLVKKTLNIPFSEVYKFLEGKGIDGKIEVDTSPILSDKIVETFHMRSVGTLLQHHKHFFDRGITKDTLEVFEGGVSMSGYMRNRYTFPIFAQDKTLIGFSGRALLKGMLPKWKNKGKTRNWLYPLFINREEIVSKKEVYLVESIGDMLSLWQSGVKNVIVLFGTKISKVIISELIAMNVEKIYVSLNNEPDNNSIGNIAADKIVEKLTCIFDEVELRLPFQGDFSDMLQQGVIKDWIKQYG